CAAFSTTHRPCRPVGKKMTRPLPEPTLRRTSAVAAAVLALAIAGCADMGAIASNPKLQTAESLGLAAAPTVPAAQAAPALDSQWWLAFGDPQLNALVDQATEGNP